MALALRRKGTRKLPSTRKADVRKPPRLQLHRRAKVVGQVYIHNDERLFIAPLNNISAGGIFINGITSLRKGNNVKVIVKSPELDHAVQAKGKVVRIERSDRRGLAVEFTDISETTRQFIERCIDNTGLQSALKVI